MLIKAFAFALTLSALPLMGDVTVVVGRGVTAGGGATYLVKQDFEGTGYDNGETWTESGAGTVDEDWTDPLIGTQSLRLATVSQSATNQSPTFTAQAECYGYFVVHGATVEALNRIWFTGRAGTTVSLEIRRESSGVFRLRHGTTSTNATTGIVADITYHVWWHYNDDSGPDDGTARLWISTTDTKPGSPEAVITTGTATGDIDNVVLGAQNTGTEEIIFDKVRVDNVDIGSSPE